MACPDYLVYQKDIDWVVRRADSRAESGVRLPTREAALLRARELGAECGSSRIVVRTARGIVTLSYGV